MTTHVRQRPFWPSKTGIALLVFLSFAGFLLLAEHWAHVAGILPLALPLILCLGMHFFMHGAHGDGGHDHGQKKE